MATIHRGTTEEGATREHNRIVTGPSKDAPVKKTKVAGLQPKGKKGESNPQGGPSAEAKYGQ
jgi:hypothetical protein